jgi:hypothetical protein
MALVAAANNTMPLTPPPDQPMFQNLDAFIKMPDTPMVDQFEDDDLESVLSDEELDVEKAHLVTHAKVYAIAEKYVPPVRHYLFSSFCMITPWSAELLPFAPADLPTLAVLWCIERRLNTDKPRDLRHQQHPLPNHNARCTSRLRSTPQSSIFFAFMYDLVIDQLPISFHEAFRAAAPTDRVSVPLLFQSLNHFRSRTLDYDC